MFPSGAANGVRDPIRVLLVDDEPAQMEMARVSLTYVDPHLEITEAETPGAALSIIEGGEFDCVVSDYQMPGMDGIRFCAEVRKRNSVPFIIYTGRGSEEVAAAAFSAGVDDYVRKEKELGHYQVLAKRIRHAVERMRTGESLRVMEQRDRELLASIGDGFFALDHNYRYTYANNAAANKLGFKPADLIGRNIWETFPKLLGTPEEIGYREAMEKREIRRFLTRGTLTDRVYSFSVYPSTEGISIFWTDMTDQKLGEDELARLAGKRSSGIDLIGNVPWGTHFCQFYQTKQDLVEILVPYFKAGLEGNEFCMWVTSEPLLDDEARGLLAEAAPEFSKYVESGQIEILSYKDWYVKEGGFDSGRVLQGWIDKLDAARKKGFSGLRLTGNTFWLEREQWGAFTDYEAAVNSVIGQYNMIALCTYSLAKCNAREILDVVKNHRFALIKSEGRWELIQSGDQAKAEAALRVSEDRYRRIVETAQEGIAIAAPSGGFTFVNQRFADLLGHPRENILGKSSLDFMDESEGSKVEEARERLRDGGSWHGEFLYRRGDGSELWMLASASPLYDAEGGHIGNLAMYSDITQRKRDEQELQRSKLAWERTFDTVPDLIALLDGKHRIIRANRAMAETLSTSTDRCVGLTCYECVHGTSCPPEICPHAKTIVDGKEHIEEVFEPRLGGHFIVSTTPLKDEGGRTIGSVHVARNITERKRAEQMLADAYADLQKKTEQLEITNESLSKSEEDLAAINEELRITNEHLSASEEELSTSNEELRSANEEMNIINSNLGATNLELSEARIKLQEYANEMETVVGKRTREIREVKERLQAFMDSAVDAFSIWDSDLNLIEANHAWRNRLPAGKNGEMLFGKNIKEVYPGVEASGNLEKYKEVVRTGEPIEFMLVPREPSFEKRSYFITAFRVHNGLGIISRDDTERVRLGEQLKADRERLSAFMEAATDGFSIWDSELRLLDANASWMRRWPEHYRKEDMIGRKLTELYPGVEETPRYREYLRVKETGVSYSFEGTLSIPGVNKRVYAGNVFRVGDGLGMTSEDITDRIMMDEKLRASALYTRGLIEASVDPLVTISADGKITDVNRATETMTGVPRGELVGSDFSNYFTEPDKARAGYEKVFKEGEVRDYPLAIRRSDNRVTDVLYNATVYRDEAGRVQGVFAAARDVTVQRRLEERLREVQRREDIERISSMVAHDIRNPLNSAAQALEMAARAPGNNESLYALASRSVSRAIRMIEELRENTRVIQPSLVEVNIRALVEDTLRELPRPDGVAAELVFTDDVGRVRVDPALVRRVLENLVGNAVEAMPEGGRLRVRAWREGGDVQLSVSDTGVGIPAEMTGKIFTPLYTTKAKGVGLGLSFCRRAVEAHDGSIWFESTPGKGTTFTVRLPQPKSV